MKFQSQTTLYSLFEGCLATGEKTLVNHWSIHYK